MIIAIDPGASGACVALDDEGQIVAGLSVSAPTDRHQEHWAALIKATALTISQALGQHP